MDSETWKKFCIAAEKPAVPELLPSADPIKRQPTRIRRPRLPISENAETTEETTKPPPLPPKDFSTTDSSQSSGSFANQRSPGSSPIRHAYSPERSPLGSPIGSSIRSPVSPARSPARYQSGLPVLDSIAPRLTASSTLLRDRASIISETSIDSAYSEPWRTHMSSPSMELDLSSDEEDLLEVPDTAFNNFLYNADLADESAVPENSTASELPVSMPKLPFSEVRLETPADMSFEIPEIEGECEETQDLKSIYRELAELYPSQERESILNGKQVSWYTYWGLSEEEGVALRDRIGEKEFKYQCQLFEPVFLEVRLSNNFKRVAFFQSEFSKKKESLVRFDSEVPETLFEPILEVYRLHRDYLLIPLVDLVRKQMFIDPDQFADIYFNWYTNSKQAILNYFKKGSKIVSLLVTTRDSPLVLWFDEVDKRYPGRVDVNGRELFLFYLRTRFGSLNVSLSSIAELLTKRGNTKLSHKLMGTKQKLDALARKGCGYLKIQEDMRIWDHVNFKHYAKIVNINSRNRRSRGIFALKRKSHTGYSNCHLGILDNYVVLLKKAKPAGFEVLTCPIAIQKLDVELVGDGSGAEFSRASSVRTISTIQSRSSVVSLTLDRDLFTFRIRELEDSKKGFVLGDSDSASVDLVISHLKKAKELYYRWAMKMVKLGALDSEVFSSREPQGSPKIWDTDPLEQVMDEMRPSTQKSEISSRPVSGAVFSYNNQKFMLIGCITGLYIKEQSKTWKKALDDAPIFKVQVVDQLERVFLLKSSTLTSMSLKDLSRLANDPSVRLPLKTVEIERKNVRYFTVGHSMGSLSIIEYLDVGSKNLKVFGWDIVKDAPVLKEKMNCRIVDVTGLYAFEKFFAITSQKMGFGLANISSQAMISIPESKDHMDRDTENLFARIKDEPSCGMFKVSATEYLLVYERYAVVMSKSLYVTTPKTIEFGFRCSNVVFEPFSKTLIVFGKESVHFFSIQLSPGFSFRLTLVLPASDVTLLSRMPNQIMFSVASPTGSGRALILGVGM
ncbi:unnamed protein product [Kuraishia capsulata CBS 1993]|uniref:CNH domain-containing protein n=1 Tax=Kuraishia capsulata CBS 1993 TaxID=1382522 RepID=W6MF26_9ASCO|nr:uncharacterized protein KUCA_T00000114001 [Kuraishia capsulata CBS 1993]CDK24154.1 unnamed protein product [Kuraishia capsulata CBS 1993]